MRGGGQGGQEMRMWWAACHRPQTAGAARQRCCSVRDKNHRHRRRRRRWQFNHHSCRRHSRQHRRCKTVVGATKTTTGLQHDKGGLWVRLRGILGLPQGEDGGRGCRRWPIPMTAIPGVRSLRNRWDQRPRLQQWEGDPQRSNNNDDA